MIRAVLIDLGKTILTNEYINFIDGLKAIYDLDTSKDKVSFDEYVRVYNNIKKITFDYRKYTHSEIRIGDILKTINDICLINVNDNVNLEEVFLYNFIKENLEKNVYEFLKFCKDNNIYVIGVSNSSITSSSLKKELSDFKVLDYFNDVISSADIYICKPRKEIFSYGISKVLKLDNSIKNNEIIFVGNDYNIDMMGSFNCEIRPFWYNVADQEDCYNVCEYIFNDYLKLIDYIKKENNI